MYTEAGPAGQEDVDTEENLESYQGAGPHPVVQAVLHLVRR